MSEAGDKVAAWREEGVDSIVASDARFYDLIADAMLLVGRLAGLNVRYQHGDSAKDGIEGMYSTHMWNMIELDGAWRMIDVTWDDS